VLAGQLRGKGPGVGSVGVAAGDTAAVFVGSRVAFGFPGEAQLASKSRKVTNKTEGEGMCMNIFWGIPLLSLHLSNLITSIKTALQL
jgi:hypothetical protein